MLRLFVYGVSDLIDFELVTIRSTRQQRMDMRGGLACYRGKGGKVFAFSLV
jgi:hypothetical protein